MTGKFPEVAGYEILGELGRGGMGVVYKARQLGLDRIVALKMVLAGDSAEPREQDRFRNEANAVAQLAHPNFVQIYDIGEHMGQPYITLEFVDGGSLASRTAGTPQPPRLAAQIVETLARAMFVAHQARIIHRDLKPANVLLTSAGVPKIADFGLAKRLDRQIDLTGTGAMVGSPNYMSPEAALGKIREIGPAADIYGLGAILYALLTGRPPFVGRSLMHTLMLVGTTDPVPPSQLVQGLPPDLETICQKAMHREPRRRYPTAHDLAEDLQRWLTGQPIQARPVGILERTHKWVRRRPAAAALIAVAFLGTLALAALSTKLADANTQLSAEAHRARIESLEAEAQRENAKRAAELAEQKAREAEDNWHTAQEKEREARHAQQLAESARREAELSRVLLLRETGVLLCREGKPGVGLARLLEALRSPSWATKPAERDRLLRIFGAWARCQPHLRDLLDTKWLLGEKFGRVEAILVSPDRRRLAVMSNKQIRICDLHTGAITGKSWNLNDREDFRSLAWSPDGRVLAAGTTARENDTSSKRYEGRLYFLRTDDEQPVGERFTVTGKSLVASVVTTLVDNANFNPEPAFKALRFASDGRRLLAGGGGDMAVFLDVSDILSAARSASPVSPLPAARLVGAPMVHGQRFGVDGHYAYVQAVDLSPDGRLAVTGSSSGTIRVWRTADSAPTLPEPLTHAGCEIRVVAFSPCGRFIVSGGDDGYLRFWDAATGASLISPLWHKQPVRALDFADGRTLVVAADDFSARLWDVSELTARLAQPNSTGLTPRVRPIGEPLEHDERVTGCHFFDAGRTLVTADHRIIRLWRRQDVSLLTATEPPLPPADTAGAVTALQWDARGQTLWAAHSDTSVRRWSVPTLSAGKATSRALGPATRLPSRADALAGVLAGWTGFTAERPHTLTLIAPAADQAVLVQPRQISTSNKPLLRVTSLQAWQPSTSQTVGHSVDFADGWFRGAIATANGQLVAVWRSARLSVLDLRSGRWVCHWLKNEKASTGPKSQILAADFGHTGELLAVGEQHGHVAILDLTRAADNRLMKKLDLGVPVVGLRFTQRDSVLLVVTADGSVRRWDPRTGSPLGEALLHNIPVVAVDEDAQAECLTVACADGSVWCWDPLTGLPLGWPYRLGSSPTALRFSPDGTRLAVGQADGTVLLLTRQPTPRDDPDGLANWLIAQFRVTMQDGREFPSDPGNRQRAFEKLRSAPVWPP